MAGDGSRQQPRAGSATASPARRNAARHRPRTDAELERQWRLGKALHDDLCQELAGVSFACESFRQKLSPACERAGTALGRVADMILQALAKARRIADELDPVSHRPDGLTVALGELAARSAVRSGARVQFTARSAVDVRDRHVAVHLFRVAERAVQDALVVSEARSVTITLARTAAGLHLTVAANKVPSTTRAAAVPKGTWQAKIQKTKKLGGRLTIARSRRTGATTVACVLPDGRGKQERP